MPSAVVFRRGARPRSQSPPGGFDSVRRTRPRLEKEERGRGGKGGADKPSATRARSPSPPGGSDSARRTRPRLEKEEERGRGGKGGTGKPSATRARSPSPPGGSDSTRRKRPRLEEERGIEGMASALPDDMLLEVFKRLAPLTDIVRCAAVCRRWRQVVSGAAGLPAPPPYFGFFRNYAPSPLPPFVPTAGVGLDLGDLPVSPACGALVVDCRGRRLLLREFGAGSARELRLLVCDPLRKTSVPLPSRFVAGHKVACCALLPEEGTAFRVVVVLFGAAPAHFDILVYSSAASTWEATTGYGLLGKSMIPRQGPTVVIGDVVYKLQSEEDKYIMSVHATKMTLSAVPLPNTGMHLYAGNHWIGKTEDGRLCFFALREQLVLVKWVLESNGNWAQRPGVDLRVLMNPATVGDLSQMKLSAKIADQLRGCKLVSFGGFCEGNGALFFVMADWVVALDLTTGRFERMWRNTDESRPLGDIFPIEMMVWPPASHDDVSKKE